MTPKKMKAKVRTSLDAHLLHLPASQHVLEEQQVHPLQENRVVEELTIDVEMHCSCQALSRGSLLTHLQLTS